MSKSIAIIDTPSGCANCIFSICKYSHPFWSKEKPSRKGYCCKLLKSHHIMDVDYDDKTTKQENCPLKEFKEK